jgi:hypothetical protein
LQHPPPLQQADDEVAVAEPANAITANRIDRYFIEPPVEFPLNSPAICAGAGAVKRARRAEAESAVASRESALILKM